MLVCDGSLSSSEAATLTMHMYWKGEGELHSRLEYKEEDGGALIPTLDGWRDKVPSAFMAPLDKTMPFFLYSVLYVAQPLSLAHGGVMHL